MVAFEVIRAPPLTVVLVVVSAVQTSSEQESGVAHGSQPVLTIGAVHHRRNDGSAPEAAGGVVEGEVGPSRHERLATSVGVLDAAFEGQPTPITEAEALVVEVQTERRAIGVRTTRQTTARSPWPPAASAPARRRG